VARAILLFSLIGDDGVWTNNWLEEGIEEEGIAVEKPSASSGRVSGSRAAGGRSSSNFSTSAANCNSACLFLRSLAR